VDAHCWSPVRYSCTHSHENDFWRHAVEADPGAGEALPRREAHPTVDEAQPGAVQAHTGAVGAQPGVVEAHTGAVEAHSAAVKARPGTLGA
jgi:hypothetical protein